ncbi:MAG: hypothetical protein IJ489_11225 [Clostridia bacterium]|nr:hypothetical protein [Clostridia bacterium]
MAKRLDGFSVKNEINAIPRADVSQEMRSESTPRLSLSRVALTTDAAQDCPNLLRCCSDFYRFTVM